MTFQILNQDGSEPVFSEGNVRGDDESELVKTSGSNGYGEVLVDLDADWKDLGLIADD